MSKRATGNGNDKAKDATAVNALAFTKRPCKIGSAINTRTEKHGDDDVPACDVPIEGFMLEESELNALLKEPLASTAFFNTRSAGRSKEPLFRTLKPLQHAEKFEASAVIHLGGASKPLELPGVRVSKIKLDPQPGGLTLASFSIQASEDVAQYIGKLVAHQNGSIDLEIELGEAVKPKDDRQQQLPINTFGDGEQDELH